MKKFRYQCQIIILNHFSAWTIWNKYLQYRWFIRPFITRIKSMSDITGYFPETQSQWERKDQYRQKIVKQI